MTKEMHHRFNRSQAVLLVCLTIIGLVLRMVFSGLADRTLRWDAEWYFQAGQGILEGKAPSDCCFHGAGYPFMIASVLAVFGQENVQAVRIAQIVLDIITGALIGAASLSVFGTIPALVTYGLYMTNPFTSSYTGLLMSEVFAMFLIALLSFIFTRKIFREHWVMWIVVGFITAYLFVTKPGFVYFVIPVFVISVLLFDSWKKKLRYLLGYSLGVVIASIIPLFVYFTSYNEFALSPPYTLSIGTQLYMNYFLIDPLPEVLGEDRKIHPEWERVQMEYFHLFLANKYDDVSWYNKRYTDMFIAKLPTMWPTLANNTVRNFFYFWDKRNLFLHIDILYPQDIHIVRTINIIYFVFFTIGLLYALLRKNTSFLYRFIVMTFLYIGALFPLVSNLPRHSLPFYPLLLLLTGYGITVSFSNIVRVVRNKRVV